MSTGERYPRPDPAPAAAYGGRDEESVRRFVERIALLFADWGFPRMAGRVLFALMTADEPGLSAAQLAERLDASPAAISGAVRYLGQFGLLVREPVPGSRRDLYRMPVDTWYTSTVSKIGLIDAIVSMADEAVGALGGDATPSGARVAELRDFYAFVRGELDGMLERWQTSRDSR
jgi:hypothetical protein